MKQHMSSFKKDITKIMMLEDEIIAPKKKKTLSGFQIMDKPQKSESDGSTKGSSNSSTSTNSGQQMPSLFQSQPNGNLMHSYFSKKDSEIAPPCPL